MSDKSELCDRTSDACEQLTRYGGAVASPAIADLLDAIVRINDDVIHARDQSCIDSGVKIAKAALLAIEGWTHWDGKQASPKIFDHSRVAVLCRNGEVLDEGFRAIDYIWKHDGEGDDIVGYRLLDNGINEIAEASDSEDFIISNIDVYSEAAKYCKYYLQISGGRYRLAATIDDVMQAIVDSRK